MVNQVSVERYSAASLAAAITAANTALAALPPNRVLNVQLVVSSILNNANVFDIYVTTLAGQTVSAGATKVVLSGASGTSASGNINDTQALLNTLNPATIRGVQFGASWNGTAQVYASLITNVVEV